MSTFELLSALIDLTQKYYIVRVAEHVGRENCKRVLQSTSKMLLHRINGFKEKIMENEFVCECAKWD